ncbi:hypothetical protein RZO55_23365 [Clostridium boliviensis]|uniref:Molecular chaperone GrpE n=1 Tax=Clostridium boliviensis TaxID=318465 RepID=A0ABU4GS92_9CLOT|nr:hypothetical protein [Clostridium boliviensis]MDW2800511.1 hypothetical protein [Clostridium boliviensis]
MSNGKEQQLEIKTIKERTIEIKLSDADVERLYKKAGSASLSVSELLENFVGDLVNGTYTNGSDERAALNNWFERCYFGMFPEESFLKYLIDQDTIEEFLELYNDMRSSVDQMPVMEEEFKTGIMKRYDGSTYTWQDLVVCTAEGDMPRYSRKEEWEKEQLENIKQEKEFVSDCKEQIDDYWNDFLQSVNGQVGTLENEIEKVIKWYGDMDRVKNGV